MNIPTGIPQQEVGVRMKKILPQTVAGQIKEH
jgi:hypothetical protein